MWVRRSAPSGSAEEAPAPAAPRRISLLTEAIGYIGAILIIAGGGTAIGERWEDLSDATRIAVFLSAAVVFLVAGTVARLSTEPAFRRLSSVVWLASTISVAIAASQVAILTFDWEGREVVTTVATIAVVYAAVLWMINREAVQHLATFGAGVMFVNVMVSWTAAEDAFIPGWRFGTASWLFGLAWATASWRRLLPPWWVGVPLGIVTILIAPTAIDVESDGRYALGLVTAGAIMALSVGARFTPGLALGAVGLFGYVTGTVVHYFADSLGIPTALALTGVAVLVIAVVTARLMGEVKRSGPEEASVVPPTLRKAS